MRQQIMEITVPLNTSSDKLMNGSWRCFHFLMSYNMTSTLWAMVVPVALFISFSIRKATNQATKMA